jgi:hypothetical protein
MLKLDLSFDPDVGVLAQADRQFANRVVTLVAARNQERRNGGAGFLFELSNHSVLQKLLLTSMVFI